MRPKFIKQFSSESLSLSIKESVEKYLQQLNKSDPEYLYRDVMKQVEYPLLKIAITRNHYNQSKAARCLGLNRYTLHKKLKTHGLL